jgi:hypothetical protein
MSTIDVSSKAILKARRMAKRVRTPEACKRCKQSKIKCSEHRPCKRCVVAGANCPSLKTASNSLKKDSNFSLSSPTNDDYRGYSGSLYLNGSPSDRVVQNPLHGSSAFPDLGIQGARDSSVLRFDPSANLPQAWNQLPPLIFNQERCQSLPAASRVSSMRFESSTHAFYSDRPPAAMFLYPSSLASVSALPWSAVLLHPGASAPAAPHAAATPCPLISMMAPVPPLFSTW